MTSRGYNGDMVTELMSYVRDIEDVPLDDDSMNFEEYNDALYRIIYRDWDTVSAFNSSI